MHQYKKIHPQTRLIIAGTIGFLIAVLATVRIWFPTLLLLDQFSQFSPLLRAVILVKLFSPLLSFLLAGGWAWILLLLGERLLLVEESMENTNRRRPSQDTILQEHQYRLERSGTTHKEDSPQLPHVRNFERQIAVPPLFQLDPAHPWQQTMLPATPLPMTNPGWSAKTEQVKEREEINSKSTHRQEKTNDKHANEQEVPSDSATSGQEATHRDHAHGLAVLSDNHMNGQGMTCGDQTNGLAVPSDDQTNKQDWTHDNSAHEPEVLSDDSTNRQDATPGTHAHEPTVLSDDPTNRQEKTRSNSTTKQEANQSAVLNDNSTNATPGTHTYGPEKSTGTQQAEQIMQSRVVDIPLQQKGQAKTTQAEGSRNIFSLQKSGEFSETLQPVTLTLLKQIRCWIRADDGTSIEVKLRGGDNAIRLLLLAYIAWRRGAWADRDKMLTHVVAKGKRRDMNTDQLGEVFDAAKRYLRQDLDRAIKELGKHGHPITKGIDFFSNEPGFYQLHSSCRVQDLERIDELSSTIQMARKEGVLDEKLNGTIPDWVVETCQQLIGAYPGDFLQSLLEKFPEEFGSWVKEPFTLYRDKYLDALLIIANYESALGRNHLDEDLTTEKNEEQRRYHIGRAAQLFYDYAMYSINSRWDQKLKFTYRAGKDGERVIRSERAMRRCVVELGKLGNPDMIDQAYLRFKERMSTLSEGSWKPGPDTESDVAEAKKQTTNAYRFSSQIPSR